MEYWDLYVITKERVPEIMEEFIETFIPESDLMKVEGEYSLGTYEGNIEITNAKEYIAAACFYKKSNGGFRINGNSKLNPEGGWLYFNSDGTVVFGLTAKESTCKKLLKKLKAFVGSEHGYVAGDCPPASSEEDFLKLCK
jgi:hypothetical protein